jgi:hypothetical protein
VESGTPKCAYFICELFSCSRSNTLSSIWYTGNCITHLWSSPTAEHWIQTRAQIYWSAVRRSAHKVHGAWERELPTCCMQPAQRHSCLLCTTANTHCTCSTSDSNRQHQSSLEQWYQPFCWHTRQSFWLQSQTSRFDSQCYQVFWEVVGLEQGPLSLVSKTEELLGRNSSGSGLETENTAVGIRHADHVAPSIRKSWN